MKDANHSKKIDSILNEELPVGDEENLKSTSDKTIDISGKRFETINEAVEEDIKEENDLKEKAKKDGDKKYKYFIYLALILIITCIVVLYNLFKTTDQIDPSDDSIEAKTEIELEAKWVEQPEDIAETKEDSETVDTVNEDVATEDVETTM